MHVSQQHACRMKEFKKSKEEEEDLGELILRMDIKNQEQREKEILLPKNHLKSLSKYFAMLLKQQSDCSIHYIKSHESEIFFRFLHHFISSDASLFQGGNCSVLESEILDNIQQILQISHYYQADVISQSLIKLYVDSKELRVGEAIELIRVCLQFNNKSNLTYFVRSLFESLVVKSPIKLMCLLLEMLGCGLTDDVSDDELLDSVFKRAIDDSLNIFNEFFNLWLGL